MTKPLSWLRRFSQAIFLLAFIYVLWSTTYPLTGLLPPDTFFKADPLIMVMTSVSERILLPGLVISLCLAIITAFIGRFFCGWICPLGTALDMVAMLKRKRLALSDRSNAVLRKFKFYLLGAFFLFAVSGRQVAWVCDPLVIMGRFVCLNLIPVVTTFINSLFVFLMKNLNLDGPVRDIYHSLKGTLLGVKVYYFSHSLIIFLFFMAILATSIIIMRFWCRAVCPLGAGYAALGIFAPLRRMVDECRKCGRCKSFCRTGAIKDDLSYVNNECILCMDCVYSCPQHVTRFKFTLPQKKAMPASPATKDDSLKMSRKNFLFFIFSSFFLLGTRSSGNGGGEDRVNIIRPPAALEEEDFVNRCIRCGNCMKVCITNGLQPVMFQTGPEGIWTPQLVPEIGYCEYHCTLCGRSCPTGAIPALTEDSKLLTKLGLARIDQTLCLPWAKGEECIVCQEHCPIPDKAIKLDTYGPGPARPYIDEYLCVGCGICQNKCPVRPVRAVRVSPKNSQRTKA